MPAYLHASVWVWVRSHDLAPQVMLKCVKLNKWQAGPSADQRHNSKYRPVSCWSNFLCNHFRLFTFYRNCRKISNIQHKLKTNQSIRPICAALVLRVVADQSKCKVRGTAIQFSLVCATGLIEHITDDIDCFCTTSRLNISMWHHIIREMVLQITFIYLASAFNFNVSGNHYVLLFI